MFNCHENPIMPPPRGAVAVSFINELTICEKSAVFFLRYWGSTKTQPPGEYENKSGNRGIGPVELHDP